MTSQKELARQIEQQYQTQFVPPFPLDDVQKLKATDASNLQSLHASLNAYFAYVAGYAVSASRLNRRPLSEIAEARKYLSEAFFDRHSSFASYRSAITGEFTPDLFHRLETVEGLRKQLVVLMDQILSEPVSR